MVTQPKTSDKLDAGVSFFHAYKGWCKDFIYHNASLCLVSLVSALFLIGCSKDQGKSSIILAQVEDRVITVEEFEDRLINFTLLSPIDNLQVRQALLQNIINEKVLLIEADKLGLREREDFKKKEKSLEINSVLNSYRDIIADERTVVEEKDVIEAFALKNEKVAARHLFAQDLDEANKLYAQLESGATFEELARKVFKDPLLANTGGYLNYFSWEDMELAFQEAAQQLKIGEYSKPVKTNNGFSIIKVEDRFRNPVLLETEYQKHKKRLKWIVTHRKRAKEIRKFDREELAKLNISYHDKNVSQLADKFKLAGEDNPQVSDIENQWIFNDLNEDLILAEFSGGSFTIKDFRDKATFTSDRQRSRVKNSKDLIEFIAALLLRDEFLRRAKKADIHQKQEVLEKIEKRKELFLIEKMKTAVYDTVRISEREALKHYQEQPQEYKTPRLVNIQEITVPSKEEADQVFTNLRNGAPFADMAKKFSKRKWTAKHGGEVGYVPKGFFGKYGDAIFSLKRNEMSEPFETNGYYTIVKVLDFKPERQKSFDEAYPEIEEQLIFYVQREALFSYIQRLRKNLTIEINENHLIVIKSPL